MTLRVAGYADSTTWLTIWAKGVTIVNMCAAQGMKGVWTGFGEPSVLILILYRIDTCDF